MTILSALPILGKSAKTARDEQQDAMQADTSVATEGNEGKKVYFEDQSWRSCFTTSRSVKSTKSNSEMTKSRSSGTHHPSPLKMEYGDFSAISKLSTGHFSDVFTGINTTTNEEVSMKFEPVDEGVKSLLANEVNIMHTIHEGSKQQGFLETVAYFDSMGFLPYNVLVTEKTGKSLRDVRHEYRGSWSLQTTVLVAEQVLQRLEFLHSKGLVHRNMGPRAFCFGVGGKAHHVYLCDLGLTDPYWKRGRHAKLESNLVPAGDMRYLSLNAHDGFTLSRRDDLIAAGYMLLHICTGHLPWSKIGKHEDNREEKIYASKSETFVTLLCYDAPEMFNTYMDHVSGLKFSQRPDYHMLFDCFHRLRYPGTKDHDFPWLDETGDIPVESSEALVLNTSLCQPDDKPTRSFFALCKPPRFLSLFSRSTSKVQPLEAGANSPQDAALTFMPVVTA